MPKSEPNSQSHIDSGPGGASQSHAVRLIAASFTPMKPNGDIDDESIDRYAEYLTTNGVHDVFINGTTGESLSLTVEERLRLVEAWTNSSTRLRIIVQVGHNCQRECVRMAGHAEAHGAAAIAAMATTFFSPASVDDLLDFLEPIAAAASDIDFYYYHLPSMTGLTLDIDDFLRRAAPRIPNLAGIKYTHEDLLEYARCLATWGDTIDLFFGRDELLLPAAINGARGAVGSFYGLIPDAFRHMLKCVDANDLAGANEWSLHTNRIIDICREVGVLPAGKFMLAQHGIGSGKVRSPLRSLDAAQQDQLLGAFAHLSPPR